LEKLNKQAGRSQRQLTDSADEGCRCTSRQAGQHAAQKLDSCSGLANLLSVPGTLLVHVISLSPSRRPTTSCLFLMFKILRLWLQIERGPKGQQGRSRNKSNDQGLKADQEPDDQPQSPRKNLMKHDQPLASQRKIYKETSGEKLSCKALREECKKSNLRRSFTRSLVPTLQRISYRAVETRLSAGK
jgi:hypothetical protein